MAVRSEVGVEVRFASPIRKDQKGDVLYLPSLVVLHNTSRFIEIPSPRLNLDCLWIRRHSLPNRSCINQWTDKSCGFQRISIPVVPVLLHSKARSRSLAALESVLISSIICRSPPETRYQDLQSICLWKSSWSRQFPGTIRRLGCWQAFNSFGKDDEEARWKSLSWFTWLQQDCRTWYQRWENTTETADG